MENNNTESTIEEEMAPLELLEPTAIELQDDDYQIMACDGDQMYLWLAVSAQETGAYTLREIYPGLSVPHTSVRDLNHERELLVPDTFEELDAVMEYLAEVLFEDFEDFGEEATGEGDVCMLH